MITGTVDALTGAGVTSCWQVELSLGFHTLEVVFAADTGALLLAWLPPEG